MRTPAVVSATLLLAVLGVRADEEPPPPARPAPALDRALPHHPGGIAWEKDLAAAEEAAAKDGRPVALYFTFDT